MHREPEVLAEALGRGVVAGGDIGGVQHGGQDHVAEQQPPGDAFARGQRRGQQASTNDHAMLVSGKLNR